MTFTQDQNGNIWYRSMFFIPIAGTKLVKVCELSSMCKFLPHSHQLHHYIDPLVGHADQIFSNMQTAFKLHATSSKKMKKHYEKLLRYEQY